MSAPSSPPEAVIQTAARLLAAGRAVEAADRLQALVDEAPTYAAAHVLLASALDATGRQTESLEIWRRAAFLVPHSPLVHREHQRLVEALQAAPAETAAAPEESPVEAWEDGTSDLEASSDVPDDAPAPTEPSPKTEPPAPPDASPDLELTTPDEPASKAASSMEEIASSDPASPGMDRTEPVVPEAPEPDLAQPEDNTSEVTAPSPEPIETPLLPPEGTASSAPRPPVSGIELEDDGWTLIEDDEAPHTGGSPVTASLLPPEPRTATQPPVAAPTPVQPAPSAAPPEPDSSLSEDLDNLITQLDAAPRIKPDPTFSGPKVTFDDSSMDDMVSETLAKIYEAQHQYVEAAVVYEKLAAREPGHAETMLERAAQMREKAS